MLVKPYLEGCIILPKFRLTLTSWTVALELISNLWSAIIFRSELTQKVLDKCLILFTIITKIFIEETLKIHIQIEVAQNNVVEHKTTTKVALLALYWGCVEFICGIVFEVGTNKVLFHT